MKFQLDEQLGGNVISQHDGQCVWINGMPYRDSVLVPWRGQVALWPVHRFEDLAPEHFEQILGMKPELVILGTGSKLRFASPALSYSLINAGIGLETMDFGAACRTYNVLASEGRSVLAALLIER
ncbi:Mth938-like domain-containing protein [Burkholderiaceae bacterium UC74_6]